MSWLLLLTFFSFASDPSCPTSANLNPNNLSPEAIKHFSWLHKLKTPEDLVCCIAKLPNIQIAIAPMSDAAQNGDYKNPRVLIIHGDSTPTPSKFTSIFSINSGAKHLQQNQSVEMMFNDPSGKLAFTDIDFSKGKPHFSKRNPESCMLCHGDAGKVPASGPQPIFDVEPWPKFLMEQPTSNSRDTVGQQLCNERNKLEPQFEKWAKGALQSQPRYSCIKDKPRINIAVLDGLLLIENSKRIARIMSTSRDYQKFKFAIVASQSCSDFLPENYIPDSILKTMNQQDELPLSLKPITSKKDLYKEAHRLGAQETRQANLRDLAKADKASLLKAGKPVHFSDELRDSLFCGSLLSNPIDTLPNAEELYFPSSNMTYNRYQADFIARRSHNAELRFLFESRGISTSNWDMRPVPGYTRGIGRSLLQSLLALESPNSKLVRAANFDNPNCPLLAQESLRAFGVKENDIPTMAPTVDQ